MKSGGETNCVPAVFLLAMQKIIQSKSKQFALACAFFLAGVTVTYLLELKIQLEIGAVFLIVSIVSAVLLKQRRGLVLGLVCLNSFVFGIIRYGFAFPRDSPQRVEHYEGAAELVGVIDAEPDIRLDGVRYLVAAESVDETPVAGRVYLKNDRYPQFAYGDRVRVTCRLARPEPIVDEETGQLFRYDLYLGLQRVYATCNQARINKLTSGQGNAVFTFILRGKHGLAEKIGDLWPEPEASFMAGILYGYRGGLGDLNEMFSRTGVTHIVAVSGFNISVIATILITTATYACVPRRKAFWFVSTGIVGFVIFTGASASVVRAGVMGIIALLAKHVGRSSRIGNVMLAAATLMVINNPLVLWSDAGFQLSFLSTLGLVYVGPLFEKWQKYLPTFLGLQESLLSTMSAIIATLPLILYQFGRLSLVAPIVNILILWVISWLMLAGTVAVVVAFVSPWLGALLAWPAHVGMQYIISVVAWFSKLSWAAIDVRAPAWIAIAAYAALVYAIYCKQFSKPYG